MTLEIRRRIRDNLYGSVDISTLEDAVISHPMFQRLRRIKQTAFLNLVFPGASHTRLEHSLGVMHLAGLAWSKIQDNQQRLRHFCSRYRRFDEREKERQSGDFVQGLMSPTFSEIEKIFTSSYVLQTLRLGALLHDIGHPPFSHSGERFLADWDSINRDNPLIPPYLKAYLSHKKSKKDPVTHEVFSILMIDQMLHDIYHHSPSLLKVAPQDVASLIAHEINPLPNSELLTCSALHICRELISGEVDIDRMDYLRRDAKECGVAYGFFDVDRILDSLAIYTNSDDGSMHLSLQYNGLPAFEDYLRARQSMYVQLYFHKTTTACEAMLQKLSEILGSYKLPSEISEYALLDEYEIRAYFDKTGKENLSRPQHLILSSLLTDLFMNRKLWKMVYEVTEEAGTDLHRSELDAVTRCLKEEHLDYELVSSHNVLTKFRSRKNGEKSENYLRLIKLDERQFLRVEAVEDFSSIIKEGGVQFHRIYVTQEDAREAEHVIREVLER
jgi:HD superfamily phosphohydrolase